MQTDPSAARTSFRRLESECMVTPTMCMNCVSNVDAIAATTVAGVVIAINAWERVSDRRRGITRLERAQRTWLRNESFMRTMGLDPVSVLGPPPGTQPTAPSIVLVRPAAAFADPVLA